MQPILLLLVSLGVAAAALSNGAGVTLAETHLFNSAKNPEADLVRAGATACVDVSFGRAVVYQALDDSGIYAWPLEGTVAEPLPFNFSFDQLEIQFASGGWTTTPVLACHRGVLYSLEGNRMYSARLNSSALPEETYAAVVPEDLNGTAVRMQAYTDVDGTVGIVALSASGTLHTFTSTAASEFFGAVDYREPTATQPLALDDSADFCVSDNGVYLGQVQADMGGEYSVRVFERVARGTSSYLRMGGWYEVGEYKSAVTQYSSSRMSCVFVKPTTSERTAWDPQELVVVGIFNANSSTDSDAHMLLRIPLLAGPAPFTHATFGNVTLAPIGGLAYGLEVGQIKDIGGCAIAPSATLVWCTYVSGSPARYGLIGIELATPNYTHLVEPIVAVGVQDVLFAPDGSWMLSGPLPVFNLYEVTDSALSAGSLTVNGVGTGPSDAFRVLPGAALNLSVVAPRSQHPTIEIWRADGFGDFEDGLSSGAKWTLAFPSEVGFGNRTAVALQYRVNTGNLSATANVSTTGTGIYENSLPRGRYMMDFASHGLPAGYSNPSGRRVRLSSGAVSFIVDDWEPLVSGDALGTAGQVWNITSHVASYGVPVSVQARGPYVYTYSQALGNLVWYNKDDPAEDPGAVPTPASQGLGVDSEDVRYCPSSGLFVGQAIGGLSALHFFDTDSESGALLYLGTSPNMSSEEAFGTSAVVALDGADPVDPAVPHVVLVMRTVDAENSHVLSTVHYSFNGTSLIVGAAGSGNATLIAGSSARLTYADDYNYTLDNGPGFFARCPECAATVQPSSRQRFAAVNGWRSVPSGSAYTAKIGCFLSVSDFVSCGVVHARTTEPMAARDRLGAPVDALGRWWTNSVGRSNGNRPYGVVGHPLLDLFVLIYTDGISVAVLRLRESATAPAGRLAVVQAIPVPDGSCSLGEFAGTEGETFVLACGSQVFRFDVSPNTGFFTHSHNSPVLLPSNSNHSMRLVDMARGPDDTFYFLSVPDSESGVESEIARMRYRRKELVDIAVPVSGFTFDADTMGQLLVSFTALVNLTHVRLAFRATGAEDAAYLAHGTFGTLDSYGGGVYSVFVPGNAVLFEHGFRGTGDFWVETRDANSTVSPDSWRQSNLVTNATFQGSTVPVALTYPTSGLVIWASDVGEYVTVKRSLATNETRLVFVPDSANTTSVLVGAASLGEPLSLPYGTFLFTLYLYNGQAMEPIDEDLQGTGRLYAEIRDAANASHWIRSAAVTNVTINSWCPSLPRMDPRTHCRNCTARFAERSQGVTFCGTCSTGYFSPQNPDFDEVCSLDTDQCRDARCSGNGDCVGATFVVEGIGSTCSCDNITGPGLAWGATYMGHTCSMLPFECRDARCGGIGRCLGQETADGCDCLEEAEGDACTECPEGFAHLTRAGPFNLTYSAGTCDNCAHGFFGAGCNLTEPSCAEAEPGVEACAACVQIYFPETDRTIPTDEPSCSCYDAVYNQTLDPTCETHLCGDGTPSEEDPTRCDCGANRIQSDNPLHARRVCVLECYAGSYRFSSDDCACLPGWSGALCDKALDLVSAAGAPTVASLARPAKTASVAVAAAAGGLGLIGVLFAIFFVVI